MNVTLLGAGGKMGGRFIANLRPRSEYSLDYVEISDTGRKRLAEQQIEPVEVGQAIRRAEVVILAIPDASIGKVTHQIVPKLRPRTMIFGLDPAAAWRKVVRTILSPESSSCSRSKTACACFKVRFALEATSYSPRLCALLRFVSFVVMRRCRPA